MARFDRRERRLDSAAERLREAEDILREIDALAVADSELGQMLGELRINVRDDG